MSLDFDFDFDIVAGKEESRIMQPCCLRLHCRVGLSFRHSGSDPRVLRFGIGVIGFYKTP